MEMPSWLGALLATSPGAIPQPQPPAANPAGPLQGPSFSMPSFQMPSLPSMPVLPGINPNPPPVGSNPLGQLPPLGPLPSIINPNPPPPGSNPLGNLRPLGPLFGGGAGVTGESNPEGVFVPSVPNLNPPRGAGPVQGPNLPAGPMPAATTVPTFNKKPLVGGIGSGIDINLQGSPFPGPAQADLSKLPQLGAPVAPDFSKSRAWFDKAAPSDLDTKGLEAINVSNVLGGLARGAGSVSATEPGSFAKALAAAGAGGSEGRGKALEAGEAAKSAHDLAVQHYATQRAEQEQRIAQVNAEVANAQRQTTFQNAKLYYDAAFKNAELQHENDLARYGIAKPEIKPVTGGVAVTQVDPNTGKSSTKIVDTKGHYEQLNDLSEQARKMGLDPTPILMQYIQGLGLPPHEATHMMEHLALGQVIKDGQGSLFGNEYTKAVAAVDAALKTDKNYELKKIKDPFRADAERNDLIVNELHRRFKDRENETGDGSWKGQLSKYHGYSVLPNVVAE